MRKDILQIPLPGGSGRVSSGPMQFQDDWPGLWIRGDQAIWLAMRLEQLGKKAIQHADLEDLIDTIKNHVRVRPGS